ncbi:MAG: hypothetical protein IPG45_20430 [Deltaproteobacteria bacterium]|nr:hypothetical protein [Deltaproteobacteria bacterium]
MKLRLPATACLVLLCNLACASGPTASREDRSESSALEIERSLREAKAAMEQLDAETAEARLTRARALLESPDGRRHPDRAFQADDLKLAERQLVEVKKEVARRDLERRVGQQRVLVEEAYNQLEVKARALDDPDQVDEAKIEAVGSAQAAVADRLLEGTPLEAEAPPYAEFVKKVRKKLEPFAGVRERANRVLAFKRGPIATYAEATELLTRSQAEEDPVEKVTLALEAKSKLEACVTRAQQLVGETNELGRLRFGEIAGGAKTGAQLLNGCQKEAKITSKLVDKLKKAAKPAAKPNPKVTKTTKKPKPKKGR